MSDQNNDLFEAETGSGKEMSCRLPEFEERKSLIVDAKPEPAIEEVEAVLKHFRETPVPEGEDPFWHDQAERYLIGLLEMLKNEASQ